MKRLNVFTENEWINRFAEQGYLLQYSNRFYGKGYYFIKMSDLRAGFHSEWKWANDISITYELLGGELK